MGTKMFSYTLIRRMSSEGRVLIIGSILAILISTLWQGVGSEVSDNILAPLDSEILAEFAPAWPQDLKVMVIDEKTAERLGRYEPTFDQWLGMIGAVMQTKPRAILVADAFDWRQATDMQSVLASYINRMSAKSPVAIFATASGTSDQLNFPSSELRKTLAGVGHIELINSQTSIEGTLGETPAAGLLVAKSTNPEFSKTAIYHVSRSAKNSLHEHAISLAEAYDGNYFGRTIRGINEGDTVIIYGRPLTNGSAEDRAAALTDHARQVLSSKTTGKLSLTPLWFFCTCLMGTLFGLIRRRKFAWLASSGFALTVMIAGLCTTAFDYIVPWLPLGSSVIVSSTMVLFDRARTFRRRKNTLDGVLRHSLTERELEEFLINGRELPLHKGNRLPVVMLLDIGGNRLTSNSLSEQYGIIHKIVQQNGGAVVRTTGEELLCLFGLSGSESTPSVCAVKSGYMLQKHFAKHNRNAIKKNDRVYSLKIAIRTGSMSLEIVDGISVAINGSAIKDVRRLRDSCISQHIVICNETHETLKKDSTPNPLDLEWTEKYVRNSAGDGYEKIFEHDPYFDDQDAYLSLEKALLNAAGISRKDERNELPTGIQIGISTDVAQGDLLNFSKAGLAISLACCLSPGVKLDLRLTASDENLNRQLEERGLSDLVGEVRWGRRKGDVFVHGISLNGVPKNQRMLLVELLTNASQGDRSIHAA